MNRNGHAKRFAAWLLALLCLLSAMEALAAGEKNVNNLPLGTLEGYRTGKDWFGDETDYDITDEAACWALLMKPITVLDVPENESVYPLDAPGGKKKLNEWQGGFLNGTTAAVHVLGEDEDGYTLIEGLDYYNRIISGYVRTNLLKQRTPNEKYGLIIDKLMQRIYVFIDGKLWSSCAVSTGLVNDEQPYNETAAGEYLLGSWVGGFDSEGMFCAMGIRFNGGDLLHQVPYILLRDGTKRFSTFEALLGQKASHGCVRVARTKNDEGLNQQWLWDNLKKGTKVIIWDDGGRRYPYPDDATELYYNPDGGSYYHSTDMCNGVREKYLPLTAFTYGELESGAYAKLKPCERCTPVKRKSEIDKMNEQRGVAPESAATPAEATLPDAAAMDTTEAPEEATTPAGTDSEGDAPGGATHGPVEIVIIPAQ